MKTLATFAWAVTVEVPADFDENDLEAYNNALNDAWANVQKTAGIITDVIEEP